MNLKNLTITAVHNSLLKREFSAVELAKFFLEKIKKNDKEISAFLTVDEDMVISQARRADDMILKNKEVPLLTGVPLSIKDNILVEGMKCTAGSKILGDYIAPYNASVVEKIKNEGGVILGKTNLDEFAMGSSTENSAFYPTKNPYDLERVAGGSSGGSAAAVAKGFSIFALGSDTGGSIRQPASFCGVVGLKPTYGSVSRYGLIAFASSLDQIGPLANTVEDARIVFQTISGIDKMDSTSFQTQTKLKTKDQELKIKNLRIGIPKEYFIGGIDPEVEKLIRTAIKQYKQKGADIVEVSLPHTEYALACYYIISTSEASANLARYDGIKYGLSERRGRDLLSIYLKTRSEGFGNEVRRRIMLGTYALSAGYYEAYYLRAQKVRSLIQKDFEKAFQIVDFIFTPTSPSPAFKIGEKINDPLKMYLSDVFTVAVNLAGLPAISIPCGRVNHLPVGLQIIGKPFEENKVFDIAKMYEY